MQQNCNKAAIFSLILIKKKPSERKDLLSRSQAAFSNSSSFTFSLSSFSFLDRTCIVLEGTADQAGDMMHCTTVPATGTMILVYPTARFPQAGQPVFGLFDKGQRAVRRQ
jgi:hypothetical protein